MKKIKLLRSPAAKAKNQASWTVTSATKISNAVTELRRHQIKWMILSITWSVKTYKTLEMAITEEHFIPFSSPSLNMWLLKRIFHLRLNKDHRKFSWTLNSWLPSLSTPLSRLFSATTWHAAIRDSNFTKNALNILRIQLRVLKKD